MLYMEELKKSEAVIMDEWRKNLRSIVAGNGVDVFEIIKRAIMVAASDHPTEFQIKRDEIAQTLFSSHHHHVEQGDIDCEKKMKNHAINYSGSDGDTTQDLVHESPNEVLRMKEILDEGKHESESVVYETLSKLQEMDLCFKTLEATKIGRSVNGFQNHRCMDIREIARRLIKKWRCVVDEWIEKQSSCVVQQEEKKESSIEKQMVKKESSSSNVVKLRMKKSNISEKAKVEESRSIERKLEETKRKLHERYEEAQNAKRQRKIQVIEPFHQAPQS